MSVSFFSEIDSKEPNEFLFNLKYPLVIFCSSDIVPKVENERSKRHLLGMTKIFEKEKNSHLSMMINHNHFESEHLFWLNCECQFNGKIENYCSKEIVVYLIDVPEDINKNFPIFDWSFFGGNKEQLIIIDKFIRDEKQKRPIDDYYFWEHQELCKFYFGHSGKQSIDQVLNILSKCRFLNHRKIGMDIINSLRISQEKKLITLNDRQTFSMLIDAYLIYYYVDINIARQIQEEFLDLSLTNVNFRFLALKRKDEILEYFKFLVENRGKKIAILHHLPSDEIERLNIDNSIYFVGDFKDSPLQFKTSFPRYLPKEKFNIGDFDVFY